MIRVKLIDSNFDFEKIQRDYINNKIGKNQIQNLLISILEEMPSTDSLLKILPLIEKYSIKNDKIFEILENLLVSDEDAKIRSLVAKIIIKNFLKEAISPLEWTIQTERSSDVIKALFDALDNIDSDISLVLKKQLFKSIFRVKIEEIQFFLDLETHFKDLQAMDIEFYKNFQTDNISQVKKGDAMYAIKNGHVIGLNLNGWKTSFESLLSRNYSKYKKTLPDIHSIPDSILNFNHLEYLDLSDSTMIDNLPRDIGDLRHLRSLILKNCYLLRELPENIGNLNNLEVLDLSFCINLEHLPDTIENLYNLRTLRLKSSSLKDLPESIGRLSNLEILDLSFSWNLKYFPETIGNLKRLLSLNLDDCNSLKELPESIGSLSNLEILDLTNCLNLEYLPDTIGNLYDLRVLKICGDYFKMRLKSIPKSIGNNTNLEVLNLKNCLNLEQLPDSLGNLPRLKTLDISFCKNLKKIPESIKKMELLEIICENGSELLR